MPIYEYQCQKCHHHLEALQKISDKPLRECPECGRHTLTRLVSAPLFRLAGSGWYETDFKSDKEARRNLAGKDEAPAEGPKAAEDKAESKPEALGKPEKAESSEKPRKPATRTVVSKPASAGRRVAAKTKPATRKPAAKKSAEKR